MLKTSATDSLQKGKGGVAAVTLASGKVTTSRGNASPRASWMGQLLTVALTHTFARWN